MRFLRYLVTVFVLACVFSVPDARDQRNIFKAPIGDDAIQRVTVIGGSYFFDPDYIIVKANIPVELTVRKEAGITPHDIVLQAPESGINFREDLSTDPKIIRFTPTKVGKYTFYCSKKFLFFKSHRTRGMEGILEVVD
ncbi:MAG: quinol oxidase [Nitrospirota bacterium]